MRRDAVRLDRSGIGVRASNGVLQRVASRQVRGAVLLAILAAQCVAGSAAASGKASPAGLGVSAATAERVLGAHVMQGLDGRAMTLGALAGNVVVVNFWASWCPPCRRELPRLGRMQTELATSGAHVLAISIDADIENARRFCRANAVTVPVAHDGPDGLARALDVRSVPLTLVLDRSGRIASTTSGSDERALAEVTATALRLQAVPPSAAHAVPGERR